MFLLNNFFPVDDQTTHSVLVVKQHSWYIWANDSPLISNLRPLWHITMSCTYNWSISLFFFAGHGKMMPSGGWWTCLLMVMLVATAQSGRILAYMIYSEGIHYYFIYIRKRSMSYNTTWKECLCILCQKNMTCREFLLCGPKFSKLFVHILLD